MVGGLTADVGVTGAKIRSPQVGNHDPHSHRHVQILLPLPFFILSGHGLTGGWVPPHCVCAGSKKFDAQGAYQAQVIMNGP